MFKNYEFRTRVVKSKTAKTETPDESGFYHHIEKINEIATKQVKNTAIAGVAIYTTVKVVKTACEIAVNYAPKN